MERTPFGLVVAILCAAASSSTVVGVEQIAGGVGPDGWTVLDKSSDTRVIYVSSSEGDDSNDGLTSEHPIKTIEKGFGLLRDDHSDWLLLKRGDVWYEPIGRITAGSPKSGRSALRPTVIGSYGEGGARPLLKLGDHRAGLSAAVNRPHKVKNLAVVGIHFYDQKGDPGSPEFVQDRSKRGVGISWLAPGENLLIEDCRFQYLTGGAIQGRSPWKGTTEEVFKNVQVRRCVAEHAWSTSGHCQGFFFSKIDGLILEENVLDHNGYNLETGDRPTWFNHNVYITIECDNVAAQGNIVARGSTTGIYCRTNGVLENNLCIDNSPSLNPGRINKFRPGGVTGRIAGNVVIGAGVRDLRQIEGLSAGPAIELANVNYGGAVVEKNIVIGDPHTGDAAFRIGGHGVGAHNIVIKNNTVYRWAPAFQCFANAGRELAGGKTSGIEVRDNIFVGAADYTQDLLQESRGEAGIAYRGNVCYSPSGSAGMARPARERPIAFLDPGRTVAAYHGTLGREPTREAFLAEACKQSKFNWRPEYSAAAVIQYIRDGFQPQEDVAGAGAVAPREGQRPHLVDAIEFNGHWYKVIEVEGPSWEEKRQICNSLGGYLCCVETAEEQEFIAGLADGRYLSLGATDKEAEGEWKWINGAPFDYTAWMSGQPNNYGSEEHYLATYDEGLWVDVATEGRDFWMPTGFICEWQGAAERQGEQSPPSANAPQGKRRPDAE